MTAQQQQQQQTPSSPATPAAASAVRLVPRPAKKKKTPNNLEDRVLVTRTPDEETEDGRIRNREAARQIRDTWIYKQVRARQDEFTQYRQVRRVRRRRSCWFYRSLSLSLSE